MNCLWWNPTDCQLGTAGHITPELTRAFPPPPLPLLAVRGFSGFLIALLSSTKPLNVNCMPLFYKFFIIHLVLR